jgi:hypothetical protein
LQEAVFCQGSRRQAENSPAKIIGALTLFAKLPESHSEDGLLLKIFHGTAWDFYAIERVVATMVRSCTASIRKIVGSLLLNTSSDAGKLH